MKEASQPRKARDTFLAGFYVTTKHAWERPPSPQPAVGEAGAI